MKRRDILKSIPLVTLVATGIPGGFYKFNTASKGKKTEKSTDYFDELGVDKVINASATMTWLSGSLMLPEVLEAINSTAHDFADMYQLQDKAGIKIAENTRNVDTALIIQPKIEKNVQFDSLKGEHDNQFRFEVDTNTPSNDQETQVDIFETKASKDLGAYNQQAFETLMHHDIRVIQKQKISPDLDIPVRTYRDDDHERMEKLAITVDCNSMRGSTLTLVSRLLNGTLGTNQNSQSASAHNSLASVDRIRCSKTDIDQFIQRRLNKAQD